MSMKIDEELTEKSVILDFVVNWDPPYQNLGSLRLIRFKLYLAVLD